MQDIFFSKSIIPKLISYIHLLGNIDIYTQASKFHGNDLFG